MKKAIGIFAHVDAGKTTFSEALLALSGLEGRTGTVNSKNSILDHDEQERRRGITIFSDMASFSYGAEEYYLIDTPGHVDFSAEMERALSVIDGAIILLNASDGVQSHTITLYRLLKKRKIPIFIFINKTDLPGTDVTGNLQSIQDKLTSDFLYLPNFDAVFDDEAVEKLCTYDDTLLGLYLEGKAGKADILQALRCTVNASGLIPICSGSALQHKGVPEVMKAVDAVLQPQQPVTDSFAARVFKVVYDKKDARVTFVKCLGGRLQVRDAVQYGETTEKVSEIRAYTGEKYERLESAEAGDMVGITGLTAAAPGMGLGACTDAPPPELKPALRAAVQYGAYPYDAVLAVCKKLEAADPMMAVITVPAVGEIQLCIMGKIQLEVLKEQIVQKYGMDISFGECTVLYKETIAKPVMGFGHFEPLRHYAEVHLRLEPNPGRGIEFASEYHIDKLPKAYQNLVQQHVFEREHRGLLTGSGLTDVKIVLTKGAYHLKHTSGGDFREATYRAIRQGLEKAELVLLEPYYAFLINVEMQDTGHVMTDITKRYGSCEPPVNTGVRTEITGRGPVRTLLDYPEDLLRFTKGNGAISMWFWGYDLCHNTDEVVAETGYAKERDMEHTSSSVFCAKGAGFEVKWDEAEGYMHLLK